MFWIISNYNPNTIVGKNEPNYNMSDSTNSGLSGGNVGRSIKNLWIIANLTNSKKPNLTKFKKTKNLEFIIAYFSRINCLILEAKKTFIY